MFAFQLDDPGFYAAITDNNSLQIHHSRLHASAKQLRRPARYPDIKKNTNTRQYPAVCASNRNHKKCLSIFNCEVSLIIEYVRPSRIILRGLQKRIDLTAFCISHNKILI